MGNRCSCYVPLERVDSKLPDVDAPQHAILDFSLDRVANVSPSFWATHTFMCEIVSVDTGKVLFRTPNAHLQELPSAAAASSSSKLKPGKTTLLDFSPEATAASAASSASPFFHSPMLMHPSSILSGSSTAAASAAAALLSNRFQIDKREETKTLRIEVHAVMVLTGLKMLVGQTSIALAELERKAEWELYLFDDNDVLVYDRPALAAPTSCTVCVHSYTAASSTEEEEDDSAAHVHFTEKPVKRIAVITRGTRGDVQPFLALAKGLAESKNWSVTIITEMSFKPLVKKHARTVKRGEIHFRPSGGDTEHSFDWPMAKWMMNQPRSIFQLIMLARAERVFFESEPAFSYFARQCDADLLLFGFNTATIAQILGEALQIPICGFLLQPTVIPSHQYPSIVSLTDLQKPVVSTTTSGSDDDGDDEEKEDGRRFGYNPSEQFAKFLKTQWENNIFTRRLDQMRELNGLPPSTTNSALHHLSAAGRPLNVFDALQRDNTTLLCPMNEQAFGGKPSDWSENVRFTNFIFTSELSPEPAQSLREEGAADVADFIAQARASGRPVLAITFSSMPVERSTILELSMKVCREAERKPCIVCVVGASKLQQQRDSKLEEEFTRLKHEGSIMEVPGAPFAHLFPLCDFLIVHGGLGTTGEALRAGKPCLVTGFLLFDQRFWGKRILDLGCGPAPVHIRQLAQEIVPCVDKALAVDCAWRTNAERFAEQLRAQEHGDGLQVNVDAVAASLQWDYPPATPAAGKRRGAHQDFGAADGEEEGEKEEEEDGLGKRRPDGSQPAPPEEEDAATPVEIQEPVQ